MWFIQKTMQEWDHDLASQKIGWDKSIEGKKARELFRETKRNLTNLMELLLNRVTNIFGSLWIRRAIL